GTKHHSDMRRQMEQAGGMRTSGLRRPRSPSHLCLLLPARGHHLVKVLLSVSPCPAE
ncbi:hypothetical protein STEG23_033003, partial [Scotinomys teguina]